MLNFFKPASKLGNWYSVEGDWKIGIKLNKRFSWAVFHKNKIVKRGGGITDLMKACDLALAAASELKD